jgi:hypothetical protein
LSKISLSGNASGTGTFTLASPNSSTDRTLTLPDSTGTIATVENLPAGYTDTDALDLFSATGSAPVYACRAWVNFNGTGTPAIREDGNVSSITDDGAGNYRVNFTTALPDVNYSVVGTVGGTGDQTGDTGRTLMTCNNSSVNFTAVFTKNSSTGALDDFNTNCVAVFR